jgi:hypothetical protein
MATQNFETLRARAQALGAFTMQSELFEAIEDARKALKPDEDDEDDETEEHAQ